MKNVFKIILVILAVLIVAAGGFWGGTRFAYRQIAANSVQQAALGFPNANTQDSNRPYMNQQQRGFGKDGSDDSTGQNSFRNWPNANNFGSRMMPGFAQGGMMNRQSIG